MQFNCILAGLAIASSGANATGSKDEFLSDLSKDEVGSVLKVHTDLPDAFSLANFGFDLRGGAVVIEDFKPNFDGWELTGNAWRAHPFDGIAYKQSPAKIDGFQGNEFPFPYDLSNSDTGTATSDRFKIEWDTIKIMGVGGETSATGVDLIFNGGSVPTAFGNNPMTFGDVSWNVRRHKGEADQIEIIHESSASRFGFVGVDDVPAERAITGISSANVLNINSFSLAPQGSDAYSLLKNISTFIPEQSKLASSNIGISLEDFFELDRSIRLAVCHESLDYHNVTNLRREEIAQLIKNKCEKVFDEYPGKLNKFARQYFMALGLSVWVCSRGKASESIAAMTPAERGRNGHYDSRRILRQKDFEFVCSGASLVLRDLARDIGLKAYYVGGHYRNPGEYSPGLESSNHAWVSFSFETDNGATISLPVDPMLGRVPKATILRLEGKVRPYNYQVLPIFGDELAMFGAFRCSLWSSDMRFGDRQNVHLTLNTSFENWNSINTSVLKDLEFGTKRLR